MKIYSLLIPLPVEDRLRHLHPLIKSKIRRALEEIRSDPHIGKLLKDQLTGLYSFRVSQYRIIYRIKERAVLVEVIDIDKRKIVYQKAAVLLGKMQ